MHGPPLSGRGLVDRGPGSGSGQARSGPGAEVLSGVGWVRQGSGLGSGQEVGSREGTEGSGHGGRFRSGPRGWGK